MVLQVTVGLELSVGLAAVAVVVLRPPAATAALQAARSGLLVSRAPWVPLARALRALACLVLTSSASLAELAYQAVVVADRARPVVSLAALAVMALWSAEVADQLVRPRRLLRVSAGQASVGRAAQQSPQIARAEAVALASSPLEGIPRQPLVELVDRAEAEAVLLMPEEPRALEGQVASCSTTKN